jgi:hypothetical protein
MIDDDADTLPDEDDDSAVGEASPPMTRTATSAAKPRTARKPRAKKATKPAGKAKKSKKAGKAATPSGLARVKMGGHVLWVGRAVARALTAKDRKRLKAVLKRAQKRAKSAS